MNKFSGAEVKLIAFCKFGTRSKW